MLLGLEAFKETMHDFNTLEVKVVWHYLFLKPYLMTSSFTGNIILAIPNSMIYRVVKVNESAFLSINRLHNRFRY